MADRKKTPDLLASVLNDPVLLGEDEVKAVVKVEEAKAKPQKKSQPKPKTTPESAPKAKPAAAPTPVSAPPVSPPTWEYMEVTFREYDDWRPRLINGKELRGWKSQPVIHDYLAQMGAQGWELVSMGDRHRNQKEAYFKRQISSEANPTIK